MNIAFVTSVYAQNGLGGAERTVQTLAEMLVKRGHKATVISLAPNGQASQGELNGVRTQYVPLANVHWPFDGVRRNVLRRAVWHLVDAYNPMMGESVARILAHERPDLVQTSNLLGFSVSVWNAAKNMGIPVVQMVHDYYLGCTNSSMFRDGANCETQCRRCQLYARPRTRLSPSPAAVISLSQQMLSRLERCGLFPHTRDKLVIHGANQVLLNAPMRRLPRPPSSFTVGYLGRMEVTKGVESLLDAVMKLPRGRVHVVLAGTGAPPYLLSLQERYGSPDIEFIGYVHPSELFARIDLLVVPSIWEEPLGRVIYEAYAHGIPSLVSRIGGMPEIIDEGRTGFFFQPGNAESLASMINRLADGWEGDRYQDACLAKSREFAIDNVAARYLEVWERAAGIVAIDKLQIAEVR